MGLKPVYYVAEFMTGKFMDYTLPLENVQLSSSMEPGRFQADLDLRKICDTHAEARALLDDLSAGKRTLVPVLEGLSAGRANPLTSRTLGEWWIATIESSHADPVIRLSGPEFAGYLSDLLITKTWTGNRDPFATVREMLAEAFSTDQTVTADLGGWVSSRRVEVEAYTSKIDYWAAIQDVCGDDQEWLMRTGLVLDGVVPLRATRTLILGAPVISDVRDDITIEAITPGDGVGSLLDVSYSLSEHATASTVYGWGAGAGDDQIKAWTSRRRVPGEPAKTRQISVRDATGYAGIKRHTERSLARLRPGNVVFTAVMPTDRFTPVVGERYWMIRGSSWSMPSPWSGHVRCVGWSWRSGQGLDAYSLELVEA